jgi:uncharacterized protein (DUF488 family)
VLRLDTVGHGTLAAEDFAALLAGAGIERLVDIRAFPGSRRNPQFGRDAMATWVPEAGIDYRWMAGLGGRRRPVEGSRHTALRNESFRAYADHMASDEFLGAVDELLDLAAEVPTVVMCSESVWWRCHRRLVADHLVLVREVPVTHQMQDGRRTEHVPTEGVRVEDGALVYDEGQPRLPCVSA